MHVFKQTQNSKRKSVDDDDDDDVDGSSGDEEVGCQVYIYTENHIAVSVCKLVWQVHLISRLLTH